MSHLPRKVHPPAEFVFHPVQQQHHRQTWPPASKGTAPAFVDEQDLHVQPAYPQNHPQVWNSPHQSAVYCTESRQAARRGCASRPLVDPSATCPTEGWSNVGQGCVGQGCAVRGEANAEITQDLVSRMD